MLFRQQEVGSLYHTELTLPDQGQIHGQGRVCGVDVHPRVRIRPSQRQRLGRDTIAGL